MELLVCNEIFCSCLSLNHTRSWACWRTLDTLKNNRVRYWEFTRDGRAVSHLKFYKVWHLCGIPSRKRVEYNSWIGQEAVKIQDACACVCSSPAFALEALINPKRICYLTFSANVLSASIEINQYFGNTYYPDANSELISRSQC